MSGASPVSLSLLIRLIHVASVLFLLGGSICPLRLSSLPQEKRASRFLSLSEKYEKSSWVAIGVLVMTGVGNAGAFGEALPDRQTPWGRTFMIKLVGVLLFFAFSQIRTFFIFRMKVAYAEDVTLFLPKTVHLLYPATALFIAAILTLALFLAHG